MRLPETLEQLVRVEQREKRLPSLAAAVVRDGELMWETAVGAADAEHGLDATPDTQYRIGSITKTFTAAAIMQLRDAGKLDLEDTLDRHVEGAAHRPTLRRLLSHTSGLQRETQDEAWLSLRFASTRGARRDARPGGAGAPAGRALPLLEPRVRAARRSSSKPRRGSRTPTTSGSACSSRSACSG